MEVQNAIRNGVDDLQTFVREMKLWEKEMKRREESLLESPNFQQSQDLPPVRNKVSKMEDGLSEHPNEESQSSQQKREQSLFEKERGNVLVKQEKWTQAIYHYTEAIESYSGDATFYGNRALCFLKLEQWKEAETDCTNALRIDATYAKAYFRRALALKELNQFKQAREDLLEVLQLDPDNKSAQNEIVKLEKMLELKSCEVKVDLPKDKKQIAYTKKEKGNACVKLKDWKSAIECYTEACSLYPEDASFYLNRALCFLKIHEPQKTILDCCRVLELEPENVKAFYRRALAHQKLNNLSKAHDDLLTARGIDPSNEHVENLLNVIEDALGIRPKDTNIKEESSEELKNEDEIPDTVAHKSTKRITGERFSKLGGYAVKPEWKAAHLLSKKPLRKMNIVEKDENSESILETAIHELNSADQIALDSSIAARLNGLGDYKTNTFPNNNIQPHSNANDVKIPKNCIQFMSTWDKLDSDLELQYALLKRIGGQNFPTLFQDSLESHIFSDILDVITVYCTQFDAPVYEFLDGLSKVKRFSALLLFATPDDIANIKQSLQHCIEHEALSEDQANELKSRYQC